MFSINFGQSTVVTCNFWKIQDCGQDDSHVFYFVILLYQFRDSRWGGNSATAP